MHLDTHVVVWLYAGDLERFPHPVLERLEREELAISPMVALELQYLFEIGRLAEPGEVVIDDLTERIGLAVADARLAAVARAAMKLDWTRDPFDRLIVAQAVIEKAPLLTADRSIRANLDLAVWD